MSAETIGAGSRLDRVAVPPGRLFRVAMATAVALATLVLVSSLVGALAHVDDGHRVDHVAGTWIALAREANAGTLYPPLYDGERFGGTRFMPVPIALQAAAARISGEYVVSAKALSYLLAAALLALTFVVLRRLRCPWPVAVLLSSTLLVSGTGLTAAMSIRNDAPAVLLQLGAVALVAGTTRRRAVLAAAALCVVALACKLSAVWAPIAIAVWLWRRDRRRLAEFAACFVAGAAAVLGIFEVASGGRLDENVLGLTLGADGAGSLTVDLPRLRLIAREGLGPLALLPLLAMLGTVLAAWRRELTLYHLAFATAAVVTAVVLTDPGAFVNHLLDVHVLSVLVVGLLWTRLSPAAGGLSLATAAILVALVVTTAAAYADNVRPVDDMRVLLHGTRPADRLPRLQADVPAGARLFSEDPFISASRGERPVVLDPYMLLRVAREHPGWRRQLVGRIERREFDPVVLLYQPGSAERWYRTLHFGEDVVRAIERGYRPAKQVDGYWIYRPR